MLKSFKASAPNVFEIVPKFLTNQNCWECAWASCTPSLGVLHPQLLHHWVDALASSNTDFRDVAVLNRGVLCGNYLHSYEETVGMSTTCY